MKRKFAVLLSLLFVFAAFCACSSGGGVPASGSLSQSDGASGSDSADSSSAPVSAPDAGSGSAPSGTAVSSSAAQCAPDTPPQDEPEIYPASQLVDASGIEKVYSSAGNARKGILDLPGIAAFEGNFVFTEAGYAAPSSDAQFSGDGYVIYRYDLSRQSAPVRLSFPMYYMGIFGQLLLSEDKLVYAPVAADGLTITLLDFAANQVTSVFSDEIGLPDVSFAHLAGDVFAFCYQRQDDTFRVVLCDKAGNPSVIYETDPDAAGDSRISAIDASEDTIYLLEERTQNGKTALYYICLDTDGNLLHEYSFDFLGGKEDALILPDQMTVCGRYILIRFSHNSGQPSFAVLRQDGDSFTKLDVPKPYPLWRLTADAVDGRYLVFESGADTTSSTAAHAKDIALFDTETESWKLVKLRDNTRGKTEAFCSSDGRILFYDNHFTVQQHEEWYLTDLAQCLAEP